MVGQLSLCYRRLIVSIDITNSSISLKGVVTGVYFISIIFRCLILETAYQNFINRITDACR